jgi:hypothetical protein
MIISGNRVSKALGSAEINGNMLSSHVRALK